MKNVVHIQKTFKKDDFTSQKSISQEFDGCIFENCNFDNCDLSNSNFIDCKFIDCNLSMIKVVNTSFKSVDFKSCKLLGVGFQYCADFLFQVNFEDCILDYSSFANKKMPKTAFECCSMKQTIFENTNLTQSVFKNCNLKDAFFNNTNLSQSNFTTAYHFNIDPELNVVKKARFSAQNIEGLLNKYDIKII